MEAPLSLSEVLATIPDPRDASGLRYPLPAIRNLLVVAALAGMRALEAAAQFARDHGQPLAHALGFRSARTPGKATLSNLLRRLDIDTVEDAWTRWVRARCPDLEGATVPRWEIGTRHPRREHPGGPPARRLRALTWPAVVAQIRVDRKTNEHKAALELLGVLPHGFQGARQSSIFSRSP